jgi:hypothetical protein
MNHQTIDLSGHEMCASLVFNAQAFQLKLINKFSHQVYKVRAMPYGLKDDGSRDGPFQRAQDAMMAHTVNAEAATNDAEAAFAPAAAQVPSWRQNSCMKQVSTQEQEPEVAGKTATQVAGVCSGMVTMQLTFQARGNE